MALKQLSKQLVLYFVLGGLLTLVEWLGFWVLVYACGVHYLIANTLSSKSSGARHTTCRHLI